MNAPKGTAEGDDSGNSTHPNLTRRLNPNVAYIDYVTWSCHVWSLRIKVWMWLM